MKRSGQVGLVAMGAVAFVGSYAAASAYIARPNSMQQAGQICTTRPDGTKTCQPAPRSYSSFLYPHFWHGWSWGAASATQMRSQNVALTGNAPATPANFKPAASGIERGGFGGTPRGGSFFASMGS
jgi:hypothetical protein